SRLRGVPASLCSRRRRRAPNARRRRDPCGAVAQLGERLNGIQEVRGSIPLGSTTFPHRDSVEPQAERAGVAGSDALAFACSVYLETILAVNVSTRVHFWCKSVGGVCDG